MSFKDLALKSGYRSNRDDILNDFYLPVLDQSVKYDRIAGYFSSASLSVAARGIAGLIRNGGHMRLITSPNLTDRDYEILKKYYSEQKEDIEKVLILNLDELQDMFQRDHLQALCWMLEHDKLEIKIAIPKSIEPPGSFGLFHIKVGILRDKENNVLTFSGSINETASAWRNNREEFKVFLDFDSSVSKFCDIDINLFESIWNGLEDDVEVFDLPVSVRMELVKKAPPSIQEVIDRIDKATKEITVCVRTQYEKMSLYDIQKEAVQAWFDNEHRGIFEMATGTGKTRTAIGCMVKCTERSEISLIVISAPQNTILTQWKKYISSLKLRGYNGIICDSSNSGWKEEIFDHFLTINLSKNAFLVIYTTHRTLSSDRFIDLINNCRFPKPKLLICDEVHGIGAKNSRKALVDMYDYRLGLSATPSRWFDENGTKIILDYFGGVVYEFPISRALTEINPGTNKPYLVHYYYHPIFVSLTDDEVEEYQNLTAKLVKQYQMSSGLDEKGDYLELLLFKRANIYKKAINKLNALENLIKQITITNTIIYTCDVHLKKVMNILARTGYKCHLFTEHENTKPSSKYGGLSQREFIIQGFVDGDYSALVAIKCLDEGVDIPSADQAIIMTSNGNPREYIQRIGRIIRHDENKRYASIYDLIVKPDCSKFQDEIAEVENKIFEKELIRAAEIAKNAINGMDVYNKLFK